jgi:hypothetical protein
VFSVIFPPAIAIAHGVKTMHYLSLVLADISQLCSREPRSKFKSLVMEIGMLSNVYLEK